MHFFLALRVATCSTNNKYTTNLSLRCAHNWKCVSFKNRILSMYLHTNCTTYLTCLSNIFLIIPSAIVHGCDIWIYPCIMGHWFYKTILLPMHMLSLLTMLLKMLIGTKVVGMIQKYQNVFRYRLLICRT